MPKLTNITAEAAAIIRAAAVRPFRDYAVRRDDGTFDVRIELETVKRLARVAFPGETISDTIIRVISTAGRKAN